MADERRLAVHSAIRALILFSFAMYIVYLTKTGHLFYYIAPRMQIYVKLTALGLYALAAYQGYSAYRSYRGYQAACDCSHPPSRSMFKNGAVYSLFLLPVLLGFLMPDTALGSTLAAKKGMNLGQTASAQQAAPAASDAASPSGNADTNYTVNAAALPPKEDTASSAPVSADNAKIEEMFKADQYSEDFAKLGVIMYKKNTIKVPERGYVEVLSALDMFMDNFQGKKIDISGFVYKEEGMRPDQFAVARFQIQCCSADATPLGIIVEAPNAANFAKDSWVHLSGTLGKTDYSGNTIIKIDASSISKIKAPENVYVQPEFDYSFASHM